VSLARTKRDRWAAETVPNRLLAMLRGRYGGDDSRPTRWFAVHMARLARDAMTDPRSTAALDATERHLAGLATAEELAAAVAGANAARADALTEHRRYALARGTARDAAGRALRWGASLGAHVAFHASATGYYEGMIAHARDALAFRHPTGRAGTAAFVVELCHVLREVAENPSRPTVVLTEWRTDTVRAVAAQVNATADFSALPILADALQDAGCDAAELLAHLRDASARHLRGCWALELALGRA
jgi:hypothetical protein